MSKKVEGQGKIIETVDCTPDDALHDHWGEDCTPDWLPIVKYALQWIKDAKQLEKQYRKDCTDYDGAMEAYTATILDCAKGLDKMNKRAREDA